MQLLEKITLYDLLGYTVPGSITLLVFLGKWAKIEYIKEISELKDVYGYIFLMFCVVGFLLGILISEISYLIAKHIKINLNTVIIPRKEKIMDALKEGGFIDCTEQNFEVEKYVKSMYGSIQCDPQYSRIHNYKSSELLNRNMALVCLLAGIWIGGFYQLAVCVRGSTFIGMIIAAYLFFLRYKKIKSRSYLYTVIWYIEKMSNKS